MITKKMRFFVMGPYEECENMLKEFGVTIYKKSYDVMSEIYTFYIEGNKEQAYKLLDYTYSHNALLAKWEES